MISSFNAIDYISPELKGNINFGLSVVKLNGLALAGLGETLKNNIEVIKAALMQSHQSIG